MMIERPILFSAPMVRAILDGTKTQTRRVIKPQPLLDDFGNGWFFGRPDLADFTYANSEIFKERYPKEFSPRHGRPGDRLWVRETWAMAIRSGESIRSERVAHYRADGMELPRWRPSIFMPRWASRITLEITGIRVEQLQDIAAWDAEQEGIEYQHQLTAAEPNRVYMNYQTGEFEYPNNPISSYRSLWVVINGKKYPWNSNPWVWVYSFKRVDGDK